MDLWPFCIWIDAQKRPSFTKNEKENRPKISVLGTRFSKKKTSMYSQSVYDWRIAAWMMSRVMYASPIWPNAKRQVCLVTFNGLVQWHRSIWAVFATCEEDAPPGWKKKPGNCMIRWLSLLWYRCFGCLTYRKKKLKLRKGLASNQGTNMSFLGE